MKTKERIKTYFIGFGIGLILVGLMLSVRWRMTQSQPPPDAAGGSTTTQPGEASGQGP